MYHSTAQRLNALCNITVQYFLKTRITSKGQVKITNGGVWGREPVLENKVFIKLSVSCSRDGSGVFKRNTPHISKLAKSKSNLFPG